MAYSKEILKKYLENKGNKDWIAYSGEGAYRTFQFELVLRAINRYLPPEDSLVLDVGIDPGNFAYKIAQNKRRIVIGDISEEQLKFIREKFNVNNLSAKIDQYAILEELYDLSIFKDESFDLVLCLSGTISYTCEHRNKMISEICRVTKAGAPMIISLRTKASYFKSLIKKQDIDLLENAAKEGLWEFIDTGYKPYNDRLEEPAFYGFEFKEISSFLDYANCEILEIFSLNPITSEQISSLTNIRENEDAWNNLLAIEEKFSKNTGLLEASEEIIIIARKRIA
ncbi:MAG: methyltransferase domain-containing protein [Candidatus Thorarchaeota archaeon]